ncbi:MAG: hypothetical protein JOZ62_20315 [Acidobacteriaceae bacterium]|nr:hypothetical protein [Acidobacteriaceae bacterium]
MRLRQSRAALYGLIAVISAGLLAYAESLAFVWDEGFHLLAAQLIAAGKRPYLDFCFPQTPLNAYWNAAWMLVFGESWKVTHVPAALLTIGTMFLVADFVYSRFPDPRWRTCCAIASTLFFGINIIVVQFGPIAQAYAMCLFTGFAAYRLAIRAAETKALILSFASGLFSGIAAASSLLSAPIVPVLLGWFWVTKVGGERWKNAGAFLCGVSVPFIPVFCLFAQARRAVWFNVVEYQALYRRANWESATAHDVDALTSWVDSGQALLLGLLALATVIFIARKREWTRQIRNELYLAAALAAALVAYISTAHPTFGRYYIVAIPFFAVVAGPGLYVAGSRLISPERPLWPTVGVAFLLTVAVARALFDDRDQATWARYEEVARKVREVTPHGAMLFADEQVYFLLRWPPPSGMEFSYSHKLDIPVKEASALHIIPRKELQREVKAGIFATFQTCDEDKIDEWGIPALYTRRADIADCSVFWGRRAAAGLAKSAAPK